MVKTEAEESASQERKERNSNHWLSVNCESDADEWYWVYRSVAYGISIGRKKWIHCLGWGDWADK